MLTALGLAGVASLVILIALFVAAEFAYVAVRRSRLEESARHGDKSSILAIGIHKRLSFMLSGAQLGITALSLILGFLAEPVVGPILEPIVRGLGVRESAVRGVSFTVAFLLVTAATMILGELVPKNIAVARTDQTARKLARFTNVFLKTCGPLIRVFDNASNGLLRLMRIEPVQELHGGLSAEELDVIVEASRKEGSLSESQARLLARALEFPDLDAAEAMVPRVRVSSISETANGADLRDLLAEGHARFPVVPSSGDLNDVLGVVYAKDLLGVPVERRASVAVTELMRPPVAVPEQARLTKVLDVMRQSRSELAIVVDEYGSTAGIITLEDLVEELVGSITDEYDSSEPAPRVRSDGSWSIPGWWRIDEVEADCDVALPEDADYDTIAGLAISLLGHLPAVGESVEVVERHRGGEEDARPRRAITIKALEVDGMTLSRVGIAIGDEVIEVDE